MASLGNAEDCVKVFCYSKKCCDIMSTMTLSLTTFSVTLSIMALNTVISVVTSPIMLSIVAPILRTVLEY